ncbi:hypothetical protein [Sinorhizobium fredii]|uniref:hypothetical protein n=1 Tax=Rhizobium fredii TaxID=380 RepID=UPI00056CBB93|nr:hypothetical protein [Sinorhizobium fredii]
MGSTPDQTTQKTEPWDGAKPYILKYLDQADKLYDSGKPEYYKGSTIADQSKATIVALKNTEALARNGNTSALTNATNAVNGVMTQGTNTQANQTLSQLQNGVKLGTNPTDAIAKNIANGSNVGQNYTNAAMGLQQNQANSLATGSNPAMDYLRSTASGANVGNNPWLDKMVSNSQDQIAEKLKNVTNPGIASQAAAMGRMGSGAYARQLNSAQSTAANEMAKVATDMYGSQYNQDQQNQLNAANTYGNFANQDVANRLNANQSLASTSDSQQAARQNALNSNRDFQMAGANLASSNYQNNIANLFASNDQRLNAANAANSQTNAVNAQKLNAAGMAGQTYQNQYLPQQQLAAVGQQQDTRAQDLLNADIQRWDAQQNQPLQNISNMINLANAGGYSNTTTPVYNNTAGQGLGLLAALAGLF